jgi:hypothetical protein
MGNYNAKLKDNALNIIYIYKQKNIFPKVCFMNFN